MSCGYQPNPLLIEHILQQVFESLTVSDRKTARLVCGLWFDVCDHERFSKAEAFYISNANCDTILSVLSNSRRKAFRLKFFRSRFNEDSLPLWRSCGQRIESLSFNWCTFDVQILPIVFEVCVHLAEFDLRFAEFTGDSKSGKGPTNLAAFLPCQNVVRQKLTSFCWKFDESDEARFKGADQKRFARIFPALKTLRLSMRFKEDEGVHETDNYGRSDWQTFSTWVVLLVAQLKAIETVDLQFRPSFYHAFPKPRDLAVFRKYDLNNLKRMSLPLNEIPWTVDKQLDTISAFKFWTSFTIDCDDVHGTGDLTVVAKLIAENAQLEKLFIRFIPGNATEMGVFFEALMKSRLRSITFDLCSLDMTLNEFDAVKVNLVLDSLPLNDSVRRLEILFPDPELESLYTFNADMFGFGFNLDDFIFNDQMAGERNAIEFCTFCLKCFRNVHYLNAQQGDVDAIFKYQKNLKQLEMLSVKKLRPAKTVSIVESLEVLDVQHPVFNILSAYRFPNLKCLILHDYDGQSHANFLADRDPHKSETQNFVEQFGRTSQRIATNAPNVEVLHLAGSSSFKVEAYTTFFKLCSKFTKLRHVSVKVDRDISASLKENLKAEMLKYMPLCPSVRTVWLETDKWTASLVYNVIDKTFELSDSSKCQDTNRQMINEAVDLKSFYFRKR